MKRLRLGVIGAGHLGRIHTRLIRSIEEVELIGVVDPVEESRRSVAHEFDTNAFAHHDELVDQIDAAIIATPTRFHHNVAMELIDKGIHLLVEKPLAQTSAEAAEMVAAATKKSVVLQVGHVERFNPALCAVLPDVASPKFIDAVRSSGYTFRSTDIGVVLDLMIHDLDIVIALVDSEVVDIQALGISIFGRHEDIAQARLQFACGCVANLSASRCSFSAQRQMQIFSERAYVGLDFANHSAKIVRPAPAVLRREIDFENLSQDEKNEVRDNLFTEYLTLEELEVESGNAILDEQHDFVLSIRAGHQPHVTGGQALKAITVAEQILEKIATHRWTSIAAGPSGPLYTPEPTIFSRPHKTPAVPSPTHAIQRKAG